MESFPKNLFACTSSGFLLTWEPQHKFIKCRKIVYKSNLTPGNYLGLESNWFTDKHDCFVDSISLTLSSIPQMDITRIIISPSNCQLLLLSACDIHVVTLPNNIEMHLASSLNTLTCKCVRVDEKLHPGLQLLTARWLPDANSGSYIVTLWGDNYLRVYNTCTPEKLYTSFYLGLGGKFSAALGDNVVSFDISHSSNSGEMYDIFAITSNGDLYLITRLLDTSRPSCIHGPLKMLPTCDDNYGSDFCDILAIGIKSVCFLVFVSANGSLLHVILLNNSDSESDCVAHVLEKCLLSFEAPESIDASLPIMTERHPTYPHAYVCWHSSGISIVQLSFIYNFDNYFNNGMNKDNGLADIQGNGSTISNILITRPDTSCPPNAVVGVAFNPFAAKLFTATCDGTSRILNLNCLQLENEMKLSCFKQFHDSSSINKRTSFLEHLNQKYPLKRNNTIISVPANHKDNQISTNQFMTTKKLINDLHKDFVKPLHLRKSAIASRCEILEKQQDSQFEQVQDLSRKYSLLTVNIKRLSERVEEAKESYEVFFARIENIFRLIQLFNPYMSKAELNMLDDLDSIVKNLDKQRALLSQLKSRSSIKFAPSSHNSQLSTITKFVHQQGDMINEVVQRLNILKIA